MVRHSFVSYMSQRDVGAIIRKKCCLCVATVHTEWWWERPLLLNGIFEAGILNCRAERVRNPVECDILATQWSGFLVSGTNLVGYIHWQNNFMLLKRGFKIMDLHGVFKVYALTLYIHYFVISYLIIKRMHQSCALCPLKTIIEHCLCKHKSLSYDWCP